MTVLLLPVRILRSMADSMYFNQACRTSSQNDSTINQMRAVSHGATTNNKLKQYYLQQMGIETWIRRDSGVVNPKDSLSILHDLQQEVAACERCPLHQTRTKTVFARGHVGAKLMIVGEAPDYHEDQQGLPFVGKAGHLLNQMLHSIGFSEKDTYIANVLKCRPDMDRNPSQHEIQQCQGYLAQQIATVRPQLILALGPFAGAFFDNRHETLYKMREASRDYQGIPVLVSYHPAYLLRNPADKKKAYQDLMKIKRFFDN